MLESNTVQSPDALLRMGKALLQQGQLDQAEAALRQVLSQQPGNARAEEFMGAIALTRADAGRASAWLRQALQHGGGSLARYNNLGSALYLLNRLQESVRAYENALDIEPESKTALMGIGRCLLKTGDYERAGGCFQKVEEIDPSEYEALVGQAQCYYQLNHVPQAMAACKRALEQDPDDRDMQVCYGELLNIQAQPHEALEYLEPLFEDPEYRTRARAPIVSALLPLNDFERVEKIAREAIDNGESCMLARQWLARSLNDQGRPEEAQEVLEIAVQDSDVGGGWLQLQGLRDLTDEEIERVKEQFRTLTENSQAARGALAFVIANWYEKHKDRSAQMEWLHVANELTAETRYHDPEGMEKYGRTLRTSLNRDTIPELAAGGDRDYEPVFILGLPRSGTTLLEQILGAHAELTPAGENPVMPWLFRQEANAPTKSSGVEQLTPELVGRLARRFRAYMDERYPDGRIVEKGIVNGREAGLLYCLFPNARFVEIRRHPLDVALGCYKQLFAQQNFSFRIDGIAREMKVHEDMMAHWYEHLPAPIHTVQYEELVTAQDEVTREVLEFLELPFDPKCLKFHEQKTKVATASTNQVRKGVYTSAVGKWQAYGELLDPFREALHEQDILIPGEDDVPESEQA